MWREKEVRQGLENLLEKQKKQLVEITSYDPITNLPLRKEFISLANKTVNRIGICDAQVVMIGLKNLAKINNTYGHDIGSLALKKFVKRLKPKLPAETVIGRISDDQIALFLVNRSRNGALIKFILGLSKKVFVVAEHDLPINLSIGISTNQLKCFSAEKILRESSLAQCWARQIGNNQVVHYSDKLENENLKRLMMENALRRALTNNEFIIHYQPQFSTNNRALTGCEALLRWKPTEQAELVSPLEFIPVLEETGLIESVGAWCLEEACGQYVLWREAGVQPFTLSVNVSAGQFHSGNFLKTVQHALQKTQMDPSFLCLELTESIVMKNISETLETLQALSTMGVKLSLDDFGTGYSSLKYLHQMNLDELKIDRAFVEKLPHDKTSISIVETILAMAKTMNLDVVAEGVEDEEQLNFLHLNNCSKVQGFYFSRPLTAPDFMRYTQSM